MTTDRLTVRVVAIGLVFLALAVVVALVWILSSVTLTDDQKGAALATLSALGTGAAGAAAALLARTSSDVTPSAGPVQPPGLMPGPG